MVKHTWKNLVYLQTFSRKIRRCEKSRPVQKVSQAFKMLHKSVFITAQHFFLVDQSMSVRSPVFRTVHTGRPSHFLVLHCVRRVRNFLLKILRLRLRRRMLINWWQSRSRRQVHSGTSSLQRKEAKASGRS